MYWKNGRCRNSDATCPFAHTESPHKIKSHPSDLGTPWRASRRHLVASQSLGDIGLSEQAVVPSSATNTLATDKRAYPTVKMSLHRMSCF